MEVLLRQRLRVRSTLTSRNAIEPKHIIEVAILTATLGKGLKREQREIKKGHAREGISLDFGQICR